MADRLYSKVLTLESDADGITVTPATFAPILNASKTLRFKKVIIGQPSAGTLSISGTNAESNGFADMAGTQVNYPLELSFDGSLFESFRLKASTGTPTVGVIAYLVDSRGG